MRFLLPDLSRALRRAVLAGSAVAAALLAPAGPASAAAPYANPFAGDTYAVGRTDMGVDVCLTTGAPIRAVGDAVVVGVQRNWYEREPYIWYELTAGPDAGRFVYVAEQIDHLARVGQTLSAGDVVARYARHGTCLETGWSAGDGATLAQVTTGYHEGAVTTAGIAFARFLIGTGAQGQFELTAPRPQVARSRHRVKRRRG